jgi:hypothetical protein
MIAASLEQKLMEAPAEQRSVGYKGYLDKLFPDCCATDIVQYGACGESVDSHQFLAPNCDLAVGALFSFSTARAMAMVALTRGASP